MIYGYGIDPAQSLNYCGIVVTSVDDDIRLVTIRKLKNVKYPEIERLLFHDLFVRFPPDFICIDYTNEKSLSESIEAHFNNEFLDTYSSSYHKWQYVQPVIFNQEMKLRLKQNARQLFEKKKFVWPEKNSSDPMIWSLVEELREQMLLEAALPGIDGRLRFPKPAGHDNDLITALELNLHGAKGHLPEFGVRWFWVRG